MTDFEKNASEYMASVKEKLARRASIDIEGQIELSLVKHKHGNQHTMLNHALDASTLDPTSATAKDYKEYPLLDTSAVITSDGCKTELVRRPALGEVCVIDWITFTCGINVFEDAKANEQIHASHYESQIALNVSQVLTDIFGFGIDKENKAGRNFYNRSWTLEHDAGFIALGGQNDTVMVCINGTGCTYGKVGWEHHLYAWLHMFSYGGRITRIDLAHDDLYGEYSSVDWFNEQHTKGGFSLGGRLPNVETRGNWKNPNGKGRTLYVGSRSYSKFCRIYEKGKQLGDRNSEWVRTEVELKNRHFEIDYEVLTSPSEVFLACYPCFHVFDNQENARLFERKQQQNSITFQTAVETLKKQYGRYLNFFRDVYADDAALLDELTDIKNKDYPERIDTLTIPDMAHSNITN